MQGLEQGDCIVIRTQTAHCPGQKAQGGPAPATICIRSGNSHETLFFPLLQEGIRLCVLWLQCQPVPPAAAAAEEHPWFSLGLNPCVGFSYAFEVLYFVCCHVWSLLLFTHMSAGLKFCKESWMLKLCFTAILFGMGSEPDFSKQ